MRTWSILLILFLTSTAVWSIPSGSGSEEDPFLIATLDDLAWMSTAYEYYTCYFKQTADIDANITEWWAWNASQWVYEGFTPIGSEAHSFKGHYDGQNYTIEGLTIRRFWYVGLFGHVSGGEIQNVNLTDIFYSGKSCVGGVCGYSQWGDTLYDFSNLTNCQVSGAIWCDEGMNGGIAGYSPNTNFYDCTSGVDITVEVEGYSYRDGVGGIVSAVNDGCYIVRCSNSGTIVSNVDQVAGIVSSAAYYCRIQKCVNTGSITGPTRVGGIAGYMENQSRIEDCCNLGSVTATNGSGIAGGLCAYSGNVYNPNIFNRSFNAGAVTGGTKGALIATGEGSVSMSGCFWDSQTVGVTTTYGGGTGLTTDEMTHNLANFVNAGWNFNLTVIGEPSAGVWRFDSISDEYPSLAWYGGFNYPALKASGSGTPESPYQIINLANLLWLINNSSVWSADFLLISDIDASSLTAVTGGATSIGTFNNRFTGSFDGDGHTISGYYNNHSTADCTGFFGYAYTAQISDLTLENIDVKGATSVGGFVGTLSHSTVNGCSVSGDVDGTTNVSGLVGQLWGNSTISECVSTVFVEGGTRVGGIVGYQQGGAVKRCFSSGDIEGSNSVGGLIGSSSPSSPYTCTIQDCYSICYIDGGGTNYGGFLGYLGSASVTNCYCKGRVDGSGTTGGFAAAASSALASGCFWDVHTSNKSNSAVGTGLTTDQMSDAPIFIDAGWDLLGENANGSGNTWGVDNETNNGYPFLTWYSGSDELNETTYIASGTTSPIQIPNIDLVIQFDGNQSVTRLQATQLFSQPGVTGELPADIDSLYAVWWTISPNSSTVGTYDITFDISDLVVEDYEMLHVLKRPNSGSEWVDVNELGATLSIAGNLLTVHGLSAFSDFAIAVYDESTLAITLSSFSAALTGECFALIAWETQTESDMIGYHVLRDTDESGDTAILVTSEIIPAHNTSVEQRYSFVDEDVAMDETYYYWLEGYEMNGTSQLFGPVSLTIKPGGGEGGGDTPELPMETLLGVNFPNPFNPSTTISYQLAEDSPVNLSIYNQRGQLVRTLVNESQIAGTYAVGWDGRNDCGKSVSSGLYFYRMKTSTISDTRKMLMIK